jgi:hypothetical protein
LKTFHLKFETAAAEGEAFSSAFDNSRHMLKVFDFLFFANATE